MSYTYKMGVVGGFLVGFILALALVEIGWVEKSSEASIAPHQQTITQVQQ